MNIVELDERLRAKPGSTDFVENLKAAIAEEYRLDGVTVFLREMTSDEALSGEDELLTFDQASQRFEFALRPAREFPAAWKIADRIDYSLNPDAGGDG